MRDIINCIKEAANQRHKSLRYGQAIFNECYRINSEATNQLRSTEYDCFYNDSKVDIFLEKFNELL